MTPKKLSPFNDAVEEEIIKPSLLSAQPSAELRFIDEEENDNNPGNKKEGPSSSRSMPSCKNGLVVSTSPMRRTVSLVAPLPSTIKCSAGQCSSKKTMFKVSLVTVDDADDQLMRDDYCNRSNRWKLSWPARTLKQANSADVFLSAGDDKCPQKMQQKTTSQPHLPQFLALAQPKKITTAKKYWHGPFWIWRAKFLREHNCGQEDLCKEVFMSALPHFGVLFVVSAYILLGSLMFRQIDSQLSALPFHDVLLFSFTTITTIGYGNIVPVNPVARFACVGYCLFGIPLVFLPLSNFGELLSDFYWVGIASLKGDDEAINRAEPSRLPLKAVAVLILFHSLLGGLIFHFWIHRMPIFPAIYFSFISITTIGFGDLCPEPRNLCEALVIIAYLSSGIAIMSTLFSTLGDHLRRIHYLGRDFEGAPDVRVWFGGQPLTVRELVALVANRFEIAPERLRELLAELDALIRLSDYGAAVRIKTMPPFLENCDDDDDQGDHGDVIGTVAVDQMLLSRSADQRRQHQPRWHIDDDDNDEDGDDVLLQQQSYTPTSSIDSEQQQMIQALGTLHRLTVKGTRTFHTPSLNSLSLMIRSASSSNQQQQNIISS